MVKSIDI